MTRSWRRCARRSRPNWATSRPERARRSLASSVARPSPAAIASAAARISVGVGDAQHREDVVGLDPLAAVGDELVERAERVAEAPGRRASDRGDRAVGDLDRLGRGHAAEDLGDLLGRRTLEVEALAAIDDRRHHLVRLGRREDEHGRGRRLLERLQERVPSLAREHVGLVEDVDLPVRPDAGMNPTRSRSSRMSSTERFEAASISITSSEVPAAIAVHDSHTPQGSSVGPFTQLSERARIFASEVLPVPREPTNR